MEKKVNRPKKKDTYTEKQGRQRKGSKKKSQKKGNNPYMKKRDGASNKTKKREMNTRVLGVRRNSLKRRTAPPPAITN